MARDIIYYTYYLYGKTYGSPSALVDESTRAKNRVREILFRKHLYVLYSSVPFFILSIVKVYFLIKIL